MPNEQGRLINRRSSLVRIPDIHENNRSTQASSEVGVAQRKK